MRSQYDVIIVGAGSMGMAAGYFLAKQGVSTLLIDSFNPPHSNGSHHGDTRIIRHAYGEGRQYVSLALRAQSLWSELQQESGQHLFHQTGVLSVGTLSSSFINEIVASGLEYSLPLDVLTSSQIKNNWPGISVPDDFIGCFESTSGVLFSEDCIRAYRLLALNNGASLLCDNPVTDIQISESSVIVQTKQGRFTAEKLIISSGAWTGKILKSLPLQILRKTVAWFEVDEALFDSNRFPAFIFSLASENYYGFPSIGGSGLKIGRHDSGQITDPDNINREFGAYPEDEDEVRQFLQRYMPEASGRVKQGSVCLYTKTPDENFIIDWHPEYSNVAIAAGFSGHGFKFSSVVGEILSEMVIKGRTQYDISQFSLSRFALK